MGLGNGTINQTCNTQQLLEPMNNSSTTHNFHEKTSNLFGVGWGGVIRGGFLLQKNKKQNWNIYHMAA